ncbi:MAG: SemiSWEET transporter [Candidatus Marsarchaeota archaeon]|nr:SemiSWEET transporter [Candidatus Marsarchaeota archaeon]
MADVASLLGYGAGILITVAYVPQVVRAYRSKSTKDLSKLWLVILVVGDLAWLAYGVALASLPLIASNGVLLVLTAALLAMKLRYG